MGYALQVNSEALKKACPIPFHEGRLWKGADAVDLKRQLQAHFHNMTSIMDCVGCEKCKLWGKLQLMGAPSPPEGLQFNRHAFPRKIQPCDSIADVFRKLFECDHTM